MRIYLIVISVFMAAICGSNGYENSPNHINLTTENTKEQPEQLNITILLDLSDRIDTNKHSESPEHYKRDIEIVKYFSELFVKDMENRGAFMAKGKLKVIFSPKPVDPNINVLAEKLSVDLTKMDSKQKKDIHDNLTKTFANNISKIYSRTLIQKQWIGSDIWRFFKNDVKYCIETKPNYRNILVLLTDGYIYHQDSKDRVGNRYAYLLPSNITKHKLRQNSNWEQEIYKQNFGLISKRSDLDDLEVLVLEITPSTAHKNDEDIIKTVLARWFKEMRVKRYGIYNSDLPHWIFRTNRPLYSAPY